MPCGGVKVLAKDLSKVFGSVANERPIKLEATNQPTFVSPNFFPDRVSDVVVDGIRTFCLEKPCHVLSTLALPESAVKRRWATQAAMVTSLKPILLAICRSEV